MQLNALCLIGLLPALAIPLPAGPITAQSAGANIRSVGPAISYNCSRRQVSSSRLSHRLLLGTGRLRQTRQI
jgi:hypothetical protein